MSDISLEIHHLDVRGGDATAIIVRDMEQETATGGKQIYRVLIDAGAERDGSEALRFYLDNYMPGQFDLIVATHFHKDHIEGFSGANVKFKKFIDNGAYKDGSGNFFKPKNGIGKGAYTNVFTSYKTQVLEPIGGDDSASGNKKRPERVPIPFIEEGFNSAPSPVSIELGAGTGITLTVYCANGILANGVNVLGNQSRKKKSITPNDTSLGLLLEWGDFRYLTAGDLSGDPNQSSYYNIEQQFVDYLADGPLKGKSLSVFKASHHGSEHSNQQSLFTKLKPDLTVISCNIHKQVPSPEFLRRLRTYFAAVPTATVVFTNTLKVFKADDRFTELLAMKDSITTGNVTFSGTAADNDVADNLGIKCAVIRRRVANGRPMLFMERPDRPAKQIARFNAGYEIVLMNRPENDAKQVSAKLVFASYQVLHRWHNGNCGRSEIENGFEALAAAIVDWLRLDAQKNETVGIDYINDNYPALVRIIQSADDGAPLKDLLVARLMFFFDSSFGMSSNLQWSPQPSSVNTLSSDEKKTFFRALYDNKYQVIFNKTRDRLFKDWKGWNARDPEPYTEGTPKRPREYQLEDREQKKKPK